MAVNHDIVDIPINIGASAVTTLVAAVSGKRIKVYGIWLQSAGTADIVFQDTDATVLIPIVNFTARERWVYQPLEPLVPLFTLVAGKKLDAWTTKAVQLSGRLYYAVED